MPALPEVASINVSPGLIRPSFSAAAAPEAANAWYEEVAALLRGHGLTVETGRFQSHMQVDLCNDGPVTLLLDSQKQF